MIIPIRCFTCGKPIAQDWEGYNGGVSRGESPKDILDSLGYERYCCRRMFLAHCDVIDEIIQFKL
ncbi:MAG: DNA-directed RNA polymerase subunit N [Candidatus Altiarchaeales archaeon WOR_SM1_86-2]|nr:MAG: DNA-directed RNA polymerase subunit N [Candidatus Altiarchaeales archaeon WOR_SM1_86-2]ODS39539.1 MAG: DNA-directed RNA polymerase subunit N [Candidatus Altiarchaeales archaeon WOR_SM1_79]